MNMNPPKIGVLVALASAIAALCLPLATRASSEAFTTLYSFTGGSDGAYPFGALIQGSDGNFYGTTSDLGISCGTVFRITPTGTLTTLHSFTFFPEGCNPFSGVIQGRDGNFYGTTFGDLNGGDDGTVFQVTPTGTLTTLYSFTGRSAPTHADGANPYGGVIQGSDGNFYGTTYQSGFNIDCASAGTVFQVTPTGTHTTLYAFGDTCSRNGRLPWAGLIQGSDGNFYGTTSAGGVDYTTGGFGTVFQLTVVTSPPMPPTGTLITLHFFNGLTDGAHPQAGLIQGSDGNFYGTTPGTSVKNQGTVFQVTPTGMLTTLHTFSGTDGALEPTSNRCVCLPAPGGLIQDSDGNFYGTTSGGGVNGGGTVFQLTVVTSPPLPPTATLITLHAFSGTDGTEATAGLIQASDGELYGTTSSGGANDKGTVFRLEPRLLHAVVSRKIHGSAGTFDVDLPLTGPHGIECRSGGATNDYTMIFTFANALTNVGGASVTRGTGSVSSRAIDSNDAHNYIVNLTGVTNAQYITITLTNLTDSAGNSIPSVPGPSMGVLIGDVNSTGLVDGNDVSAVQGQARQTANSTNFRLDVNATGLIDGNDVSLVQSKTRTSLPSPP